MSSSVDAEKPHTDISSAPAEQRLRIGRLLTSLFFVILLSFYGLQLWYHAIRTSATWDEPFHIVAGYRHWECGDYGILPEQPPLLKLLATLPIRSQSFIESPVPCGSKITPVLPGFLMGAQFLSQNGVDRILLRTRLAASLISLLLAALVFLAALEMFGKPEAFVALALFAFEPNLIAHGSLVTSDMPGAAMTFAAVYAFYRYRQKPDVPRLLVTGLATGLALASKHSGILILPILFVLLILDTWLARGNERKTYPPLGRTILNAAAVYAAILLLGLTVLWATYGFRYRALPGATSDAFTAAAVPDPKTANTLFGKTLELIRPAHIVPEAYFQGFALMSEAKRRTFLLGEIYPTAKWFYFPVAFTIKSSIALLLLLPLALLTPELYRKHPRAMLFLLLPSLGFFALSLTSGLNIGIRHILTVYPFFITIAAAGACTLTRKYRVFSYALIALLLFHAFTAVRTAPNYIAFANDLWGGTNNTYRLLHDSNVDLGQNLKVIDDYLKRADIHDCWLAYYGNGELARINQTCRLIPGGGWDITEQPIEPLPPVIEGTVLVSTEVLRPLETEFEGELAALAKTEPIGILGGSILVYRGRFEVPTAAALTYIQRGRQLRRSNRLDEAIADFRQALKLAPDDPRAPLYLDSALAARGWKVLAARQGAAVNDGLESLGLAGWRAPNSTYMVLLAHFGYRLQHREQDARALIDDCASKCDTTAWPYPIISYLRNELPANALMDLATNNDKMTEARAYIGMNLSMLGRPQEALVHLNWVVENGNRDFTEYGLATSESKNIEGLLNSPPVLTSKVPASPLRKS